jgi:hypothetical protein
VEGGSSSEHYFESKADQLDHTQRASDFKAHQLRQVKEELRAYRAVLRNKELID